ncbi:MAG: serine hydrolase domain-containing protein [Rhodoferax sp.]|nr:serine hydrolase domain-containing protein [Rhodoferax sp.]
MPVLKPNSWLIQRLFLAALVIFAITGSAISYAETLASEVQRYAEQLLSDSVQSEGPGVVVLVANGDEVLYWGARGKASIELSTPLLPDHVFRIGSISKQFTAAGLLKLVDAGRVSLDDSLSQYLPAYPNGKAIRLWQLLNHTSGIHDYYDLPGYLVSGRRRLEMDTLSLIDLFKNESTYFAPGTAFRYTNSNYVLLAAVIEAATGKPWDAYLGESIGKPLGLAHTGYGSDRQVIPGLVQGYGYTDAGKLHRSAPNSMSQVIGGGALFSTAYDLWRWSRALHGGRVLSQQSYYRMTTPEGAAKAEGYGYGLDCSNLNGEQVFRHNGLIFGFSSAVIYAPNSQLTVVTLSNSDSGSVKPSVMAEKLMAVARRATP